MTNRTTKTLKIDTSLWRELKIKSAEENKSMIDLAENYILQGLKKEEGKEMKISVDHPQQNIEKNIDWQDYPCINVETGKKLKYNLGHYFDSWEDYLKNGSDTNYDTK